MTSNFRQNWANSEDSSARTAVTGAWEEADMECNKEQLMFNNGLFQMHPERDASVFHGGGYASHSHTGCITVGCIAVVYLRYTSIQPLSFLYRMKKEYCPAYGKKCNKCGRFNHFSSKCKSREMKMIEKTSDDEEEFAEYYIQ